MNIQLDALPTPCLLLDINRATSNAERIGRRVQELKAALRPHIKTHKCVEVARLQTRGHSGAITVSTLAEARVFRDHGFRDITYAVPIEPGKFEAAIALSRRCDRLALLTDDTEVVRGLDEAARAAGITLDVFLDVDCGYHRTGVDPTSAEACRVAAQIAGGRHLMFAGILTHAGHSYHCRSFEELLTTARQERDVMVEFAHRLRQSGIHVPAVSIGSTPTMTTVDHLDGIDEARPGNYVFFDAHQATLGSCRDTDCALTVLTSVIHTSRRHRRVIVDAGALAMSKDRGPVDLDPGCGYGRVLDLEGCDLGVRLEALSQEHGWITASEEVVERLKIGTRVRIVPNHSCLTAAAHSFYQVLDNKRVVDQWQIHPGW